MKRVLLFFITFLCIHTFISAQEIIKIAHKAPLSIYTFSTLKKDTHSISLINQRLNIQPFCSIIPDDHNVDQKLYPLNFKEIGDQKPAYVYDDYEKYQDKTYLKEFLFTNDPTRWNLHRKENRIQPVPSNK
jgi:hypothetical protein